MKNTVNVEDNITIYAVQMCLLRIGLSVSDRLKEPFQKDNPMRIEVPLAKHALTWKTIINTREIITHQNYQIGSKSTMQTANSFLHMTKFIDDLLQKRKEMLKIEQEKINTVSEQKKQIVVEEAIKQVEPPRPTPVSSFLSFKLTIPKKTTAPVKNLSFSDTSSKRLNNS